MRKCLWLFLVLFLLEAAVSLGENESEVIPQVADVRLSTNLEPTIYQNAEYTSLFALEIKNKKPCSPKDTMTVLYNISKAGLIIKEDSFTKEIGCSTKASTGSFIPEEIGNYTLCGAIINSSVNEKDYSNNAACSDLEVISTSSLSCDISLQIKKANQTLIYENGQTIKFTPEIDNESFPFVIEYWIEDLFGNFVKDKFNTTNTNQKSWKTDIEEQDRVLFLKAVAYPSCNDTNMTNNAAEEMFIVIKKEIEEISLSSTDKENSAINITEITPQPVPFGGLLKVEVEIYKNSTNKYSLSAWAEKNGKTISEKTKVNLKNKNTHYELTLPVQLQPNCDSKIEEGTALLILEGLGVVAEKEFTLEGLNKDVCGGVKVAKSEETPEKKKNSVQILDLPAEIHPGETFRIKIQVQHDQEAEFEAWSYLYRGSKCYSCAEGEREENKIYFTVDEDEPKPVQMLINADEELSEGEYKTMVKYHQKGQKTEKSLSQIIYVKGHSAGQSSNQSLDLLSSPKKSNILPASPKAIQNIPEHEGIVVYESASEKSKNLVPWVLFVAFGLLSLGLIITRGNT